MKRTIIIWVIFSGFILLITPFVSAMESRIVMNAEKSKIVTTGMSIREQIVDTLVIILAIIGGVILHRVFDIPNGGENLRHLLSFLS